jgi:hypothetical protein
MARKIIKCGKATGLKFWNAFAGPLSQVPRSVIRVPARVAKKLGATSGSLFVPEGTPLDQLSKRSVFLSRRMAIRIKTGHTPEELAAAHLSGEMPYKSAASEAQARKTRIAYQERRDKIDAKRAGTKLKRARVIDVEFISSRGNTRHWKRRLTAADKRKFQSLRERKLGGEELDFSEWRSLIEQAEAVRDPALPRLMRSKLSPQPRELRR